MEFEAVIGLEVHAQLRTHSKIFCGCSTRFGAAPNANTCPVCLGLPGALPVLNREAVAMAVKAGLALGCRINQHSLFARKNYFYPDLPKGYQISQYEQPLAHDGELELVVVDPQADAAPETIHNIGIVRVHLEEDAGKSIHRPEGDSHVDLNRTGVPLIEIVSQPVISSSRQANEYMQSLRRILLYLEICDGNMEEGSLRCDANVSVRPTHSQQLGTKVEIKNLNSFKFLEKALDYEIDRQVGVLRAEERVVQETRLWDEPGGRTISMRSKEEAHDYRYFPEPDLLPVRVSAQWLEELSAEMPELPNQRRVRFVEQYQLNPQEAFTATQTKSFADYFEQVLECHRQPKDVFHWMVGELTHYLKNDDRTIERCPIRPRQLADLVRLVEGGEISGKIAKQVFERMYDKGEDPETILTQENLRQISDVGQLEGVVQSVLEANPKKVAAYRAGKSGLLGFFMGQVMKQTRGQANPKMVSRMLQEELGSSK